MVLGRRVVRVRFTDLGAIDDLNQEWDQTGDGGLLLTLLVHRAEVAQRSERDLGRLRVSRFEVALDALDELGNGAGAL